MSDNLTEASRRLLGSSLGVYKSRQERVAMRCALGDAAALCDVLAEQAEKQNSYSGGRVTQVGQALAAAVKQAGDAIWAMREMIDVRTPATVSPGHPQSPTGATSTQEDDGATS